MKTVIREKYSGEKIAEQEAKEMKMAPKSAMAYQIDFPQGKPGKYVTSSLIEAGNQRWQWEEEFEITEKDLSEVNELDRVQRKKFRYRKGIVFLVSIIVGTLIIYVGFKFFYQA